MRPRLLMTRTAALTAAACAVGAPTALGAQELLPDLSPARLDVFAFDTGTQPGHVLMRLDTSISNTGVGDAILAGSRVDAETMAASQRIMFDDGTFVDQPPAWTFKFASSDQHGHWHALGFAAHALDRLAADGSMVASTPLAKIGFCLTDTRSPVVPRQARYGECGEPGSQQVVMGIQSGFADLYKAELPSQWIDITGQPPGQYNLRAVADPDGKIKESDEANNTTVTPLRLPAITPKLTRERSGFEDTIRRNRRAAGQIAAVTLSHRSVVRAQVFRTIRGNAVVVTELKPRRLGPGPARIFWNARNRRGKLVPRGKYSVKLFASAGGVRSDPLYLNFRVR